MTSVMSPWRRGCLAVPVLLLSLCRSSSGMDAEYGAFQQIMLLPLEQQAQLADGILKKKFESRPEAMSYENYMGYSIPFYSLINDASFAAYRIAAVKPELLSRYEVYDDCDGVKPKTLLHCFLKEGRPGEFIDMAASCPACYGEAVSLFLWDDSGTPSGQIVGGLRFLYDSSLREGPPL